MNKYYKYLIYFILIALLITVAINITSPIKIIDAEVYISTADINDPTIKIIEYRFKALNKLYFNSVDFNIQFINNSSDHPYSKIVPNYNSNSTLSLTPRELNTFSYKIEVNTQDMRLINSLYQNISTKVINLNIQ